MDCIQEQIKQARGLERSQKFKAAFDAYATVADQPGAHSDDAGFWLPLAEVARRAERAEEAVGAYGRAIELFNAAGQPHNAAAVSRRVLRLKPDDPAALRALVVLDEERPPALPDDTASDYSYIGDEPAVAETPDTPDTPEVDGDALADEDGMPGIADHVAAPEPGLEPTAIPDSVEVAPAFEQMEGLETTSSDVAPGDVEESAVGESDQDDLPLLPNTAAFSAPAADPPLPPANHDAPADDYVDLAALVMSDDDDDTTRFRMDAASHPSGDEDRDFSEILAMFRQQVSEKIHPQDSSSHYDLGLAFKEMGLLDDAIGQMQKALTGGANPLATLEVLGECFMEKDQHSLAVRVLSRATQLSTATDAELIGVHYALGRCEEVLGNPAEADGHYEHVIAIDIGFRDAAARLEAIRSGSDLDSRA
jgi:tetratricopeptide (TPR) repeat protein